MGQIIGRLEKKTARLEEFLFLIMSSMGNFIGNYIDITDIVQFFNDPEVVSRCEASLKRHIAARKRAFRTEFDQYLENPHNCQCHACVARAMCNVETMQNSWECLEELLRKLCINEVMEEEADVLLNILKDFYYAMQFDLRICCKRREKMYIINKCIDEELIIPLLGLVEESKLYQNEAGVPEEEAPQETTPESSPPPECSKAGSPPRDDKRKKHRSRPSLSPIDEGRPKSPPSPRKDRKSAGDASQTSQPSTSKMLMQEEQDVERYESAHDRDSDDEEGATPREEPGEFVLKMVKKGGIYMPENLEELPDELKNVFKRIQDAAKKIVESAPSTSKDSTPPKPPKPPSQKPKKPETPSKPILVVPPPVQKKIQVIPKEVQQAMDAMPHMYRYGLSAKPSSVRLSERDPESIHLDDLMKSSHTKKHKEQIENPFKLRRRGKRMITKESTHCLFKTASVEKLPSEFPDDKPITPRKLQSQKAKPQPKSPPPDPNQPDTTELLKSAMAKTTIGLKIFETVFGVQDETKISQLDELIKTQPPPPAQDPREPRPSTSKEANKEEKKHSHHQSRKDSSQPSTSKQDSESQFYPKDSKTKINYDEKDLEDVDLSEASYEYGFEYSDEDEEEVPYDEEREGQ